MRLEKENKLDFVKEYLLGNPAIKEWLENE